MQKTATQNARQPVASSLSRRSVKTVVRVTNPLRGSFPNLPSSSRSDSRIGHASRLVVRATATEDLCLDVPGLGGSDVDALNREFGQEGFIHFEKGEGGLTKAVLSHPTGASAEVYLHGATTARWRCSTGYEALHLPPTAAFDGQSPIGAGLTPSFPQFGRAFVAGFEALPLHGFARTMEWEVVATEIDFPEDEDWDASEGVPFDPAPRIALRLRDTPASRAIWPHKFEIFYEVCLGLNDELKIGPDSYEVEENTRVPDPVFAKEYEAIKAAEEAARVAQEADKAERVKSWVDKGFSARWNTVTNEEDRRQKELEVAQEAAAAAAEAKALEYGADQLRTVLRVFNRDDHPIRFTTGVHSLLTVLDAENEYCRTLGLGGQTFIDNQDPTNPCVRRDGDENVRFGAGLLDRLYSNVPKQNENLLCPGDRSHFRVLVREGYKDLHVGNPHGAQPDTWRDFVAMSPCKAAVPIKLDPESEWCGEAVVRYYNKMWVAPINDPAVAYDPLPSPNL